MRDFELRGAAQELLKCRAPSVCIVGAAGTGKSVGALLKLHVTSALVPNTTSLIVRQTHASLTASTLRTFELNIIADELASGKVKWFGGSGRKPPAYMYPNGSTIMVGGMDQPGKFLSMDLDRVLVDEANQVSLTAFETLMTRMRGTAGTYKQIVMATNPDHPAHWLKERADADLLPMMTSVHQDNPYLFHRNGTPTEAGADYMAVLDALTGVRRLRYLNGIWAAAEGQVFDDWDEQLNLVDPFPVPDDWRTIWTVDFGFSNPFVWQQWRVDGDGRAYLTHEISRRQRLVEDHARDILALMEANGWARPEAIVCDHDSEDRATLERHLKMPTIPARKGVTRGVQLTQARTRAAGDGRPRLLVFRDALLRTDPLAATDKRPRGFAAEVGGYVWAVERGTDGVPKEAPLKKDDHSMDAGRYLVAHLDWHEDAKVGNPAAAAKAGAQPKQGSAWSRPVGR
jgi:phage terminase large subunit